MLIDPKRGRVKLTIVGSASAAPNPGSASSCYLLKTESGQLLLECGHGSAAKMLLYTSLEQVDGVIVSHMHPDHFFDLVPLKYLIKQTGSAKLPLFLPPTGPGILAGLAVGLGENGNFWSNAYDVEVFNPNEPLEAFGMKFTMAQTHHFIPAWSMRIQSDGDNGTLGYSSDTSLIDGVVAHLQGCDLLLAEASITVDDQAKSAGDKGHLTGVEAGQLAARTGARQLVLTHYPHAQSARLLDEARQAYSGPSDLAIEGKEYTIE